jgi:tRNA(Ile)-lysidine synthase
MQRRLLRHAARQLGAEPDFLATEALRMLTLGPAGRKLELAAGLRAERTPRELRLTAGPAAAPNKRTAGTQEAQGAENAAPEYTVVIPGEVVAPAFGLRLRIELAGPESRARHSATLRNWKPGDRVRLRYSSGWRKVKEVLERLRITGSARRLWPVLELEGRILWMQGVELEPEPGLVIVPGLLSQEDAGNPGTEPTG